jgi:hypothetical protein
LELRRRVLRIGAGAGALNWSKYRYAVHVNDCAERLITNQGPHYVALTVEDLEGPVVAAFPALLAASAGCIVAMRRGDKSQCKESGHKRIAHYASPVIIACFVAPAFAFRT